MHAMKQLSSYFIVAAFFLLPGRISACFNEYYTLDKQGHSHHINKAVFRFETNFDLLLVERQLKALEKKLQSDKSLELLSDYALNLVRAEKVKEALVVFEKLVAKYPDEYALQANLGTTYELLGDNKAALKHIKKGLELFPDSHSGSEWIHVKILEAKIALESNPNYLRNHTVLSLTPKQENSEKTATELMIQLKERFPFCKGPDAIMADLFHDLGDCYLETKSYEYAKAFYEVAVKYYGSEDAELNRKIEEARALRTKYENTSVVPDPKLNGAQYIHQKITGVTYKELLRTNSDHTINWKGITTDPKTLLGYLSLNEEPMDKQVAVVEKSDSQKTTPASKQLRKDKDILYVWGILTLLIVFIASIGIYRKTRRKS